MFNRFISFTIVLALFSACAPTRQPVPIGFVPEARPTTISDEQYGHEVLNAMNEHWELDYQSPRYSEIVAIVEKLTLAIGANTSPWHVYLFRAPDVVNAAATRGNHVFVWSGLLDEVKTEGELATVISHEISHVLAGHTEPDPNEEIKKLLIGIGAAAAGIAVAATTRDPNLGQNLGNLTSSLTQEIGEGFFVNPYSQELELEADRIGIMVLAKAGYDPQEALNFWNHASQNPNFSSPLSFFSTHPVAEDRLKQLEQVLPLAQAEKGKAGPSIKTSPQTHTATPSTINLSKNSWKVITPKAVLYSEPSQNSKPLGEFKKGAVIDSVSNRRGWIEVLYPERGFIKGQSLAPLAAN